MSNAREIYADHEAAHEVALRLHTGRIEIYAREGIIWPAVALNPAQAGDTAALAAIAAAAVDQQVHRLTVTVPAAAAAPVTLPGVTITSGTVIAANIGGSHNVGVISGVATTAGTGGGVIAEIWVPVSSAVYLTAHQADVDVYGPVGELDIDTHGRVRYQRPER